MQNDLSSYYQSSESESLSASETASRPGKTIALTRGATRLLQDMGYALLAEMTLPNGRRADLAGINVKGRIVIIEIKSCREDFMVDQKWEEYLEFCDLFFFCTDTSFPADLLPQAEGRIIADAYGGAIIINSIERPLAAARRKALTLKFARQAALRLTSINN